MQNLKVLALSKFRHVDARLIAERYGIYYFRRDTVREDMPFALEEYEILTDAEYFDDPAIPDWVSGKSDGQEVIDGIRYNIFRIK